jgi:phosphopantothenoylcysteine decarboxylase/phosphopantothenate--cysteine ligase
MVAAIADFVPAQAEAGKWKNSKEKKSLELHPSPNVLEALAAKKRPGQILVGFALETEEPLAHAWEKLQARRCDLMVVNNPLSGAGLGFSEEAVEAAVLDARHAPGSEQLAVLEKAQLAVEIVRRVAALSDSRTSK